MGPQSAWGVPSQHLGEYFQLLWGECSTILGSMFNYLGEYVTLGSMFNYPGEYVHYPGENVTLGSMFNYLGEYVQLPWGVFPTTLGSMFNYPGEYFQLPWGVFSHGSIYWYTSTYASYLQA